MTYGEQNTIEEGVALLNCAFDEYGINFLDTAEIYPVPPRPETQGSTDVTVHEFLKGRNREDVIVATKVAGRSPNFTWLPRGKDGTTTNDVGGSDLTRTQILQSVDASLERLGIEYIDLLQIHWPCRYTGGQFGSPDFEPSQCANDPPPVPFEEQLAAVQELIVAGKVRYLGLSNETPFGVCSMVALAKQYPDLYPKIVSIQNSYSLVVRKDYEAGLAEACYHHNVALLPYSPLAGGTLSGKYRTKADNPSGGSRLTMFPGFMERYLQSQNEATVNAYCDLAGRYGLTPAQLALSWCYHSEQVCSTIIGATTLDQLREDLDAYDVRLEQVSSAAVAAAVETAAETTSSDSATAGSGSNKIHDEITAIYKQYTDPTKARNNPQ